MIGINTNNSALAASAKIGSNAVEQTTVMQRLSTGVRVNSAKDDAAALAISTGLVSQIKGMAMATRNVSDGISLAQTAESALGSVVNMLQRMRELAVQSANGTLTTANRAAIQLEYDANINQINTVLGTTNFNGIKLFDGSASALQIQSGAAVTNKDTISIPQVTSKTLLGVSGTEIADTSNITSPPTIATVTKSQSYTSSNTNNYINPVYVDPNLVLTGTGKIDGASVMITNVDAAHDVLQLTSPNGITSTYDAQTGILTLTGTASIAEYQAALRQVQFKTDANAQVGKRDIKITLGTAVQGPNGHYYQFINTDTNFTNAKDLGSGPIKGIPIARMI
jgi:flagellin